jgi:NitT/TauT family transport system substrate-binding protein
VIGHLFILIAAIATFLASPGQRTLVWANDPASIRFGALPVLQALPVFVAMEKGLFRKHGVNVEVIPFATAAEKEIALTAGNVDGYFGDLVTPIVLKANGRDVLIVATNYDTRTDRRMFGILAKPGSKLTKASELAGVPVALSSNSVVNYVVDRLLGDAGISESNMASVESKNIGLRLQMLVTGQVEAAALPEPLLTAAIAKGAILLADDSGMAESQTVLAFSGAFLKRHPNEVKAFLKAVDEAGRLIDTEPDSIRSVMVEHVRLPEALKNTYPAPRFPALHTPDRREVQAVVAWLVKRGVIRQALAYGQAVAPGFIPQ